MSENSFLHNEELQFILFGGKGGVGKTTSSAATSVYLAKKHPDKKILVFSTDPAHSLSDSFDYELSNEATAIEGFDNLFAMEMNAEDLHRDFKEKHQNEIMELVSRATYFNTKELSSAFSMSYPSSFGFMAIMKMVDFVKSGEYDLVIFDTAPTGHTIQLFNLLTQINNQLAIMKKSQEKRKYMMTRLAGAYYKDNADEFIEGMKQSILKLRQTLESSKTQFVPVTIAEAMGVYETERLASILRLYKIPVRDIIVNGINMSAGCELCASRKKDQEKYIEEIKNRFPDYNVIKMPLFSHEIKGTEALADFADFLSGKEYKYQLNQAVHSGYTNREFKSNMADIPNKKGLKFIMFGGKGGVGKTTSATSTAVYLAKKNPDKKILIFSTDPAHSISDSFGYQIDYTNYDPGYQIGDKVTLIKGIDNLYALEIDPRKAFLNFKKRYEEKVKLAFKPQEKTSDGLGVGAMARATHPFDEETISDLVGVAPLGLDELMTLSEVIVKFAEEFDFIVIDTAPTGHLVRLLDRPHLVLDWFSTVVKGIRNYKGVMLTYEPLKVLLGTKKKIINTQKLLMDSAQTEFVAVTIAEAMGIYETEDLLRDIKNLNVQSKHVIINRLIPPSKCSFCEPKREEQLNYIKEINTKFPDYLITEMPLFPHEIRGINDLGKFAAIMYKTSIIEKSAKVKIVGTQLSG